MFSEYMREGSQTNKQSSTPLYLSSPNTSLIVTRLIFKAILYHSVFSGMFERPPFSEGTKRSVYHVRSCDVFRLKQVCSNSHHHLNRVQSI